MRAGTNHAVAYTISPINRQDRVGEYGEIYRGYVEASSVKRKVQVQELPCRRCILFRTQFPPPVMYKILAFCRLPPSPRLIQAIYTQKRVGSQVPRPLRRPNSQFFTSAQLSLARSLSRSSSTLPLLVSRVRLADYIQVPVMSLAGLAPNNLRVVTRQFIRAHLPNLGLDPVPQRDQTSHTRMLTLQCSHRFFTEL